ncbi:MAG: DUF5058 family protein [Acutalibacteraceae bacterium]|nr:DUF5058 family protein [Acutalibacteraceae bacterium]
MDFKENWVMYLLAACVVVFVTAQSLFFIIRSWKHGKKIGLKKETMKQTIMSSASFTFAPAVSILATVIALAASLGVVLPWIRLSVIGNLAYETTAAQTALDVFGASLKNEVVDKGQFSTIAWAMTIGSIAPLILLPFLCKFLQKKVGKAVNKSEKSQKLGDAISASAFIGIVCAFLAREISGNTMSNKIDAAGNFVRELNDKGELEIVKVVTGSSGAMSILVLITAIVLMLVLEAICKKFKLEKLETFAMPIAMLGAMGMAILFTAVLPDSVVNHTWYEVVTQ